MVTKTHYSDVMRGRYILCVVASGVYIIGGSGENLRL